MKGFGLGVLAGAVDFTTSFFNFFFYEQKILLRQKKKKYIYIYINKHTGK